MFSLAPAAEVEIAFSRNRAGLQWDFDRGRDDRRQTPVTLDELDDRDVVRELMRDRSRGSSRTRPHSEFQRLGSTWRALFSSCSMQKGMIAI